MSKITSRSESVYVVTRRCSDIKEHMVDIRGIFKSEAEARKHAEYLYETRNIGTAIETYQLLDTVEIGEP